MILPGPDEPLAIVARVARANRGTIERACVLTPYAVETIADDARAAGPGSQLAITVRGRSRRGALGQVRALFADLEARGVAVLVSAEPSVAPHVARRPAA